MSIIWFVLFYRVKHSIEVTKVAVYKSDETAAAMKDEVKTSAALPPPFCDVCSRQDGGQNYATKYCYTCEQLLCEEHLKVCLALYLILP